MPRFTLVPHEATFEFGRLSEIKMDEVIIIRPPANPKISFPATKPQIPRNNYGIQPTIPMLFARMALFFSPILTIELAKMLPSISPITVASFASAIFFVPSHASWALTTSAL